MWRVLYCPEYLFGDPGNAKGEAAGVRCVQLNEQNLCKIFGKPERPAVCSQFKACPSLCGQTSQQALDNITELESMT
ncbi:proteinase inhibitor putative [Photobacterium aphoticum]|uniref:Proteinase inhibitor putative n=1 Tax=Photobacterium aphoticum TaxID=754436 RepID=A0A090QZ01_9GAMM|nr:proteinase inhibitor putative [Photobacterium aphoticum]